MLMNKRSALLLVATLAISACGGDDEGENSGLKEGEACTLDGEDCGSGLYCNGFFLTCTPASGDIEAPTLSSCSITPEAATIGTTLTVDFEVSETLYQDPVVTIGGAPTASNPLFSKVSGTGLNFSYELTIDASVLPQGFYNIFVEMVDLAGNQNPSATCGDNPPTLVNVDFTAPTVPTCSITDSIVDPAETLDLTFSLSEPAGTLPVVNATHTTDSSTFALVVTDVDGTNFTATYDPSGTETLGEYTIRITATDVAGNEVLAPCGSAFLQ